MIGPATVFPSDSLAAAVEARHPTVYFHGTHFLREPLYLADRQRLIGDQNNSEIRRARNFTGPALVVGSRNRNVLRDFKVLQSGSEPAISIKDPVGLRVENVEIDSAGDGLILYNTRDDLPHVGKGGRWVNRIRGCTLRAERWPLWADVTDSYFSDLYCGNGRGSGVRGGGNLISNCHFDRSMIGLHLVAKHRGLRVAVSACYFDLNGIALRLSSDAPIRAGALLDVLLRKNRLDAQFINVGGVHLRCSEKPTIEKVGRCPRIRVRYP